MPQLLLFYERSPNCTHALQLSPLSTTTGAPVHAHALRLTPLDTSADIIHPACGTIEPVTIATHQEMGICPCPQVNTVGHFHGHLPIRMRHNHGLQRMLDRESREEEEDEM